MVDAQQFADLGMHAALSAAYRFDIRTRAVHLVHIGCWATDVADYTFEVRRLGHLLDLIQHRFFAAGLNDASWWAVIEQNVQPPKQPRMIVTEFLIIS